MEKSYEKSNKISEFCDLTNKYEKIQFLIVDF
jgi:hypothetical protein